MYFILTVAILSDFGNPVAPSVGVGVTVLQHGQSRPVVLSLLSVIQLSRQSSQNECWHGNLRGFLNGSRQIPQFASLGVNASAISQLLSGRISEIVFLLRLCLAH